MSSSRYIQFETKWDFLYLEQKNSPKIVFRTTSLSKTLPAISSNVYQLLDVSKAIYYALNVDFIKAHSQNEYFCLLNSLCQ